MGFFPTLLDTPGREAGKTFLGLFGDFGPRRRAPSLTIALYGLSSNTVPSTASATHIAQAMWATATTTTTTPTILLLSLQHSTGPPWTLRYNDLVFLLAQLSVEEI